MSDAVTERINLADVRGRGAEFRLRPPFRYVRLSVGERNALVEAVRASDRALNWHAARIIPTGAIPDQEAAIGTARRKLARFDFGGGR